MPSDDIVAELDRAIAEPFGWHTAILQRARDEILALRETIERQKLVLSKGHAQTRDEALEEAARVCERADRSTHPAECADMIRALKDK